MTPALPALAGRRLKVLFVHTRFPGQFARLAAALMRDGHEVRAPAGAEAGREGGQAIAGIPVTLVEDRPPMPGFGLARPLREALDRATAYAAAADRLAAAGFRPDIVYAHTGWGAGAFIKDALPGVPVVKYLEWWSASQGGDADFGEPDRPLAARLATRALDLPLLLELADADAAITPTRFQRDQLPALLRPQVEIIPDGVDTGWFRPDPDAVFELADGRRLRRSDRLVTYVARGADPYRGFGDFLEALARVQSSDPRVEAVVVGDRLSHYGPDVGTDRHFRDVTARVGYDPDRTHFVGRIPLKRYRRLLQVATVHVHLSIPFVLSWSLLEAMACGCTLAGSSGMPLEEVLAHRRNALLSGHGDVATLAAHIEEGLAGGPAITALGRNARRVIMRRFALPVALRRHERLLLRLLGQELHVLT